MSIFLIFILKWGILALTLFFPCIIIIIKKMKKKEWTKANMGHVAWTREAHGEES